MSQNQNDTVKPSVEEESAAKAESLRERAAKAKAEKKTEVDSGDATAEFTWVEITALGVVGCLALAGGVYLGEKLFDRLKGGSSEPIAE